MAVKSIEVFGTVMRTGVLALLAAGLLAPVAVSAQEHGRGQGRSEMRSEDGGGWNGRRGGGGGSGGSGWRSREAPVQQSAPQAQTRQDWSGVNPGWRQRSDGGSAQAPAVDRSEAPAMTSPGNGWSGRRGGWSGQAATPQAVPRQTQAPTGAPEVAAQGRGRGGGRSGGGWSSGASPGGQAWGSNSVRAPRPATTGDVRRTPGSGDSQWQGRNRSYSDASRGRRSSDGWQNDERRVRESWRGNNWQGRNAWSNDGRRHGYADSNRRWNHDWRRDNRYDWQGHRSKHRDRYRLGRYYAPYSGYYYTRPFIGFTLDSMFYSDRYWLDDPWDYRLPPAYGPYRWVRYYDDALLVDIYTGEVVDLIHDVFW